MFEQYRRPKHRRAGARLGGLLLAGALTAAAPLFAADAPPASNSPPAGQCNCRGGDFDIAKMEQRALTDFAAADTNHDGKISLDEFLAFKPNHGPSGPGGRGPGGPRMGMGMGMMGGGWMGHDHGPDGAPNGDWQKEHQAQVQQFQSDLFKALDTDHNGQISQAEFAKAPEVMHTLMKKQMFAKMDTNHDGFIEKDEFMARIQKMSALDTNGDGKVSRDEMKAAHDAKRAQDSSSAPSN
jgi:Ca2+-binding EF-hand superfamily protein